MRGDIEIVLTPGATREQCLVVARALLAWCEITREAELSQRVRLIVRGGPLLSPEDTAQFWRALVPPGVVENLVIDGVSWSEVQNNSNPGGGGEVDMPSAAATA